MCKSWTGFLSLNLLGSLRLYQYQSIDFHSLFQPLRRPTKRFPGHSLIWTQITFWNGTVDSTCDCFSLPCAVYSVGIPRVFSHLFTFPGNSRFCGKERPIWHLCTWWWQVRGPASWFYAFSSTAIPSRQIFRDYCDSQRTTSEPNVKASRDCYL